MVNNKNHKVTLYSHLEIKGTGYLVFRDIPKIIKKYAKGRKTLDYGCGAGRSTRFLKSLNLIVEGLDNSQEMIDKAIQLDLSVPYTLITNNQIPKKSNSYDIIFSSLVLFEISSLQELLKIFKEIYRVLKFDGIFIIVTGSEKMYNHQWLSLDTNYDENKNPSSGALMKIRLKEIDLELYDYFWTDNDYKNIINLSNFSLLEQIYPLGNKNDNYNWIFETLISPYVIYILQKKISSI